MRTASIDGKSIGSLCGLRITPELSIRDVRRTDIIVLPASGLEVQAAYRAQHRAPVLASHAARGVYIAGICSGVAFLAESGILDGRQATSHWALAERLRERYPKVRWRPELFVTEDRRVCCSGGVYACIDLSLYLVEKFCGHEIALQCARSLLVSMPRSRQSGYAVTPLSRPHSDERIREAEHLQQHFVRGVSIDNLAKRIGMSPRNFIRRFKCATGRLPGAYLLRVSSAREMLEQGALPVQTVCTRVGYEDVAFFRNLFKRHTGMTPAEYRERFAHMTFERGDLRRGTRPPDAQGFPTGRRTAIDPLRSVAVQTCLTPRWPVANEAVTVRHLYRRQRLCVHSRVCRNDPIHEQ